MVWVSIGKQSKINEQEQLSMYLFSSFRAVLREYLMGQELFDLRSVTRILLNEPLDELSGLWGNTFAVD
jgi:hypothetical protein